MDFKYHSKLIICGQTKSNHRQKTPQLFVIHTTLHMNKCYMSTTYYLLCSRPFSDYLFQMHILLVIIYFKCTCNLHTKEMFAIHMQRVPNAWACETNYIKAFLFLFSQEKNKTTTETQTHSAVHLCDTQWLISEIFLSTLVEWKTFLWCTQCNEDK